MMQEEDSLPKYQVLISDEVFKQLENIKDYISNVKLSPQSAEKVIDTILNDLESLSLFPERGFLVSERIGRELSKMKQDNRIARGLVVGSKKYLALYSIDHEAKVVRVPILVSSHTDWINLFF